MDKKQFIQFTQQTDRSWESRVVIYSTNDRHGPMSARVAMNNKIILADNTSINNKNATVCLVQSKYETENIPAFTNWSLKLPDLFNTDRTLTLSAINFFENMGITVNINNLRTTATAISAGGTFSYNSTLSTSLGTSIAIHPSVMNKNKADKRVDLNIIAWYLILKSLGCNIVIASQDRFLLNSSETFFRLK